MTRLGCILAAALWVTPQQEPEEPSVEQELAALIEKTNALETFHLIYDMENSGVEWPSKATFEFVYRAPALARLHITSAEGEFDCWIDQEQVFMRSDVGEPGDGEWHRATFPEPPAASFQLDELFPRHGSPLGPGAGLQMTVVENPESGKLRFDFSVGRQSYGRTVVLGWLEILQQESAELMIEEESLVLEGDHYRLRVSRSTGVFEHFEGTTDAGTVKFRLRECLLDEPLDADLVELPSEARTSKLDPEMTRHFAYFFGPERLRLSAFLRVEGQLESNKRPWNELTRNDWRTFLDELHLDMIVTRYSKWIEELQEHVDQLVEWVRARRAENDSPETRAELERKMAESRAKLEEGFESSQNKYVESLPAIESERTEPRQELFDIEAEVIAELWAELLCEPVLSAYDEKLAEALE